MFMNIANINSKWLSEQVSAEMKVIAVWSIFMTNIL